METITKAGNFLMHGILGFPMPIAPSVMKLFRQYAELDTSRSDGKYYAAVLDLFEPILQTIGCTTERLPIPESIAGAPNRTHLIARRISDPNLPTLIIYNHIDVVPATYENAFSYIQKNGYVYVRGAADHKGSTIAVIDALQQLHQSGTAVRFNLVFLLTTDEETSQLPQLEYLAQHLSLNPATTFCYDPDTFAGGITTAHLGIYQCKVIAHGKSVHSGMSHMGINAVESLLQLWPTISALKSKYTGLSSTAVSFPKNGASESVRSGANATMISGGSAANVIPDFAELQLDFRFAPELDVTAERAWIRTQLNKAIQNSQAEIEIVDGELFEGYACSHAEIDRLETTLTKVSGEHGQYCVQGSTPVASWAKQLGVPHFGLGVARYDSNMHGVNERCKIADMEVLSTVLQQYLAW